MKTRRIVSGLVLLALLAWFLVAHQQLIQANVTARDSIAYWAAARLLLHHQDPYSAPNVLALERSQGYQADKPLVLRTPPWSLWMVLPLGSLNPYWAWVVWLAVLLASLVLSMRISWRMYGDGGIRPPTVFLLAGYLFAPVPACLAAGQLGMVLLLGIVLFFSLAERHPWLAGAVLLLPFAKPHLFGLLWPILAIWIAARKKWPLAGGFALAFSLAVAIAWAFDPAVFGHYRDMLRHASIQHEFIPALSGVLRLIFFRRFFWAQFLPLAAGCGWSGWYYWKNRCTWSWKEHGAALLVVSVLTTPYAWITDEAILLPAILPGVLWVYRAKPNLTLRSQLAISAFACLDGLLLLILRAKIPFATGIYFWSSLVWVSWYWYAQRFRRSHAA
jgi:Glycosyltransferase family 87